MKIQFCYIVIQGDRHKNRYIGNHTHDALEIVYYVNGEGFTTFNGKKHAIRKNSFCILPKGMLHDQQTAADLTCICLGLTDCGLESHAGYYADYEGKLRILFENLLQETLKKDNWTGMIMEAMAAEAVGRVHRILNRSAGRSDKDVLIKNALNMIREKDGRISLDEIADTFYISKDYLRHLIKGYSKCSPIRHIINARIEKAKNLLLDNTLPIKEISGQCGFDDVSYFLRLFKKVAGLTPSAFRRARTGKSTI